MIFKRDHAILSFDIFEATSTILKIFNEPTLRMNEANLVKSWKVTNFSSLSPDGISFLIPRCFFGSAKFQFGSNKIFRQILCDDCARRDFME